MSFGTTLLPNHQRQIISTKMYLSTETPIKQEVSRDSIPIDYVLNRLQEITVLKVLDILDRPDSITQCFQYRYCYYPVERFTDWKRIENVGTVLAYWSKYEIWLQIGHASLTQRRYTLIAKELGQIVNKATYNLAVMLLSANGALSFSTSRIISHSTTTNGSYYSGDL